MGYKTCHELKSSLDASICAKDCEFLKKQKFARECKDKGGLYKCCIRRDAALCHECRYQDSQISGIGFPGSAARYPSAPIRHHSVGPLATQLSMKRYLISSS